MAQPIIVCLGRYGDICNALPLAYHLSEKGEKPKFVVSDEFWTVLDGVSYVQPVVWKFNYKELPRTITELRRHDREDAIICQTYMHPDTSRTTDSYQREAWRHAGYLGEFGNHPLVFDRRDIIRENGLDLQACLRTEGYHAKKRTILVSGQSVSSPFKPDIVSEIKKEFKDFNVVDLAKVQGSRIYDLLGMMEKADLIVSVDTVHIHLANAVETPLIAIINNGWFGSVPKADATTIRYNDFNQDRLNAVIHANLSHSERPREDGAP